MKKISLNNNWICKRAGQPEQGMTVNIPHDAMQMDEKDELSAGGVHNGWYVCHDYIYDTSCVVYLSFFPEVFCQGHFHGLCQGIKV